MTHFFRECPSQWLLDIHRNKFNFLFQRNNFLYEKKPHFSYHSLTFVCVKWKNINFHSDMRYGVTFVAKINLLSLCVFLWHLVIFSFPLSMAMWLRSIESSLIIDAVVGTICEIRTKYWWELSVGEMDICGLCGNFCVVGCKLMNFSKKRNLFSFFYSSNIDSNFYEIFHVHP